MLISTDVLTFIYGKELQIFPVHMYLKKP